jgi:hypothetical protein
MTVSTQQIRVSYTGDGVSTVFPIPFPFYLSTDLLVLLAGSPLASGYSVSGGNGLTGSATMASAPATGVNLQIILNDPLTQLVNLVDGTAFPSATLNQVNDRSIQIAQRLSDQISRSIRAPDGDVSPGMLLPPASARANTIPSFDAGGNLTTTVVLPTGSLSRGSIGNLLYPQTSAEIAASITPSDYGYPPFDIRRYGADPTGALASDTAMTSAIAVCGTTGGTIRLPAGTYTFAGQIALNQKAAPIILQGNGGVDAGSLAPTVLQYSGTTSPWIDMRSSSGCQIRDCQLFHTNVSFTGTYIKCGNDGTHGDSSLCAIRD